MRFFYNGFLAGFLMGIAGAAIIPRACAQPQPVPLIAEKFTAEKHAEEIQRPVHSVKSQGKKAVFTYEVPTERYGLLRGEVQAPRGALQYKHRIGIGAAAFNSALLGRLSYGYKNVEFSFYGGWDYKNSGILIGGGLGYSWGF